MAEQKVTAATIIRTVVLALALINQTLTALGKNPLPIAGNDVYEFLTLAVTIGAAIWSWWKNNSFTKNALQADQLLYFLRKNEKEKKSDDEG